MRRSRALSVLASARSESLGIPAPPRHSIETEPGRMAPLLSADCVPHLERGIGIKARRPSVINGVLSRMLFRLYEPFRYAAERA